MPSKLICQICDHSEPMPNHCGKPMHIEEIDGLEKLVCWMGPSCGVAELPLHHDKAMREG